jgi:DNA polymerase (family 10)
MLLVMAEHNAQLAAIFQQMADVTEITGGNKFKVLAFAKVARLLGEMSQDVATIDRAELASLPGIGKGTAERIGEFLDTGKIAEHQAMLETIPPQLPQLLDIPGLGPKTVALLWKQAGVQSMADLTDKLKDDALAELPGFGKKKLENLRKNIAFAAEAGQRVRLGEALPLAAWIIEQLRRIKGVKEANYAGSLRRGRETIGDIDILVACSDEPARAAVSDTFTKLPGVTDVLAHGETKSSVRMKPGIQVDLRTVAPEQYGAALLYFTGSKEYNVRLRQRALDMGYTLNEYALADKDDKSKVAASRTEEDIYKKLKLAWIPPELREDRDEIALAEKGELPLLIKLGDIRCELHAHTTASDGTWTIRELVEAAAERGFHTVAVTDHSKSQFQARGLDARRLEKHIADVRAVAAQMKKTITVLAGSEVDILSDGSLDYPDSLLKQLDIVVASPHAALSQDGATATKRLLRAIDNPWVTILGHPTGRLVGRREGLHPDIHQLVVAAKQRGIAMEINANHWRLDLRDAHARLAIEAGVKLAINTDAHGPADLDQLLYGVLTARRAGATPADVVNCLTADALQQWLASTRR